MQNIHSGLERIHQLTANGTKLLLILEKNNGTVYCQKFNFFKIDGCENKYQLHVKDPVQKYGEFLLSNQLNKVFTTASS